jgi:hypothetical protein
MTAIEVKRPAKAVARHLVPVAFTALRDASLAPPRFIVDRVLPRKVVTLLGAHGGAGKSLLALTIAAHVACGTSWAGFAVISSPVLIVSLEDPGDVVLYRLRQVVMQYGLPEDAVLRNLRIVDGTEGEALAREVSEAGIKSLHPTEAMAELRDVAAGAGLIVVDNASDGLDASENDRRVVRTFMRQMLGKVARANDAAVLLLVHIDKLAARSDSGGNTYSGSTAWHNSARSRLALVSDGSSVELRHEKSNFGKVVDPVRLRWTDDGVLVPTTAEAAQADVQAREAAQAGEDAAHVLVAIVRAQAAGSDVWTGRTGSYSAKSSLAKFDIPREITAGNGARFWRALDRLLADGAVLRQSHKTKYRNKRERLVPSSAVLRCGGPPITPTAPPQQARGCAVVDDNRHHRTTTAAPHIDDGTNL